MWYVRKGYARSRDRFGKLEAIAEWIANVEAPESRVVVVPPCLDACLNQLFAERREILYQDGGMSAVMSAKLRLKRDMHLSGSTVVPPKAIAASDFRGDAQRLEAKNVFIEAMRRLFLFGWYGKQDVMDAFEAMPSGIGQGARSFPLALCADRWQREIEASPIGPRGSDQNHVGEGHYGDGDDCASPPAVRQPWSDKCEDAK